MPTAPRRSEMLDGGYVVVLRGLTAIFLIVTFALNPGPYTFAVEHLVLLLPKLQECCGRIKEVR